MVLAAKQVMRERGYHATAFSEVLKRSGAPRGSVYFHFPGGKNQLVVEAAEDHAHEQITLIDRAAEQADSVTTLVQSYLDMGRDAMVASGYGRGCGIAPLVIESAGRESEEIGETGRRAFSEMTERLAFHLSALGADRAAARSLATAVLAGLEGAMITSRALHSPAPFDSMRDTLLSHAAVTSPKESLASTSEFGGPGQAIP
ncbi:TetR/AcrR family transcriptional regulator [Streptomyces parvulus]